MSQKRQAPTTEIFSARFFSSKIIVEIFAEILWFNYKCDELNVRPLISSQVSIGGCVMYTRVHFSVRQERIIYCIQSLAYISA